MHYINFIPIIGIFVIVSCSKPESLPDPPILIPEDSTVTLPVPDTSLPSGVYIAGDTMNKYNSPGGPVYWQNNAVVGLPSKTSGPATSIAVYGNDVYVSCGGLYYGNNVTYWKNRVGVNLDDATMDFLTATAITVSGGDLYVVGSAQTGSVHPKRTPVYWKNGGEPVHIATGNGDSYVSGVAVSGNDVYIVGKTPDASLGEGLGAVYWKNAVPVYLRTGNGRTYHNSIANSIVVSGLDVYVAGNMDTSINPGVATTIAVYWKNGVITKLATNISSLANSIAVSGNDVYVAGAISGSDRLPRSTYWKNGVPINLHSSISIANSITIHGTDIYVAGKRSVDSATYWKNGVAVSLGRGFANAIVIKD